MKKNSLLLGIILAIVGLIMTITPSGCIKAVVIILGIEAVANGVYQLLYTRKLFPDAAFQYSVIIRGMLSIVVGLLAFFLPLRFAEIIWTVMLYVLAVYLLVGSALLLFSCGKLQNTNVDRRQFITEAVISIILALIMLLIPVHVGTTLVRIAGIVLILTGAAFIVLYIKNKPLVQGPVQVMDDISGDLTNS